MKNKKIFLIVYAILLCVYCNSCYAQNPVLIDVKKSGAKGDGISDDTKALRAAFASVSKTGGTVFFPKGVYITDIIDIRPNPQHAVVIKVKGVGSESIIRKSKTDTIPVAVFFCEIANTTLEFSNLSIDGNYLNRTRKWKTVAQNIVDLDEKVNGIYAYNVNKLNVHDCFIKNLHGDAIACFSAGTLLASKNIINNVSGTGIIGHRVNDMVANYNVISNTGFITNSYILDGKAKTMSGPYPLTKSGDGIEGDCKNLTATHNKITNPGRCGVVHDLARDLQYVNSTAIVTDNVIVINSLGINNSNPPAGMWFEQSANVTVNNNNITFLKSKSKLTSGIRFFDVSNMISCNKNTITATNYNHVSDNAIGVFEPRTDNITINGNVINGKFKSGIALSYEGVPAKVKEITITANKLAGSKQIENGIVFSISGERKFPENSIIQGNDIRGVKEKPLYFFYYGAPKNKVSSSIMKINENKMDLNAPGYLNEVPVGVSIKK